MRCFLSFVCFAAMLGVTAASGQLPPPPVTRQDCTKLKGKDRTACETKAKADDAAAKTPAAKGANDPFPFPEDQSRRGGEQQHGTGDMPTSGVPDPPSESVKPSDVDSLPGSPVPGSPTNPGNSSSSSSSSSSADGSAPSPSDTGDDAAPTTAGSDSPVKPSALKDLGSRGDTSAARVKLEQTRVEDDLKVGGFYYKDGNLTGALARYRDALQHDPDNPDAHFGLAQVLLKQSKRDEAVTHLQKYVQLAPDDEHTKEARKLLSKLQVSK